MKKTLLILAAGLGSRYKGGIKQIAPVGPCGEILLHYSIHDAVEAGFDKIVFVIKRDIEKDFRERIHEFASKKAEICYAFQDEAYLPKGFVFPPERTKLYGTVQAVLAAKDVINEPFAIINADDYYGKSAFTIAASVLSELAGDDDTLSGMVGYRLLNTISYNGTVNRGVCLTDENGYLTDVKENYGIFPEDGAIYADYDKEDSRHQIDPESVVSMNFWCFRDSIFDKAIPLFDEFIGSLEEGDAKSEYLLPTMVDDLIKGGSLRVKVYPCSEIWHGITYPTDRDEVAGAIKEMTDNGLYPIDLNGR